MALFLLSKRIMKTKAKESMTRDLITIGWMERMSTAYQRMKSQSLRHLPVLNETGEVVGMLSDRDVQRAMISEVSHGQVAGSSESIEFDPEARVRDYMGWPVLTVDPTQDVRAVAEQMLREKVSSFLVQDMGKAVGIITTDDLIRLLIRLLQEPQSPPWSLKDILESAEHRMDGLLL